MAQHPGIISTADGSPTIIHPFLKESYHSVNGAMSESQHVFINAGLAFAAGHQKELVIFEVGLGTGLNALLCFDFALKNHLHIRYLALEPFPLDSGEIETLSNMLPVPEMLKQTFSSIHAEKNIPVKISDRFIFTCYNFSLQDYEDCPGADVVFYDAFSPVVQPEMWTEEAMSKIKHIMREEGVLVTYCAKGSVKRALKATGFLVESLPGATGKREMIRAIKK